MSHTLKIFAIPAPDSGGENLDYERRRVGKLFPDPYIFLKGIPLTGGLAIYGDGPNDFIYVENFRSIGHLLKIIRSLINADPDKPCLSVLEIHAHANPTVIDGLYILDHKAETVKREGAALKRAKWCDAGSIYLSGCNTGLTESGVIVIPPIGSIAKELAKAMAYNAATFPVHITVYGSAGFLLNTHFDGSAKIRASTIEKGGDQPPYDGARSTSVEKNCWNPFNNY